jgi:Ca2+-binding EF-hand superfamily protein
LFSEALLQQLIEEQLQQMAQTGQATTNFTNLMQVLESTINGALAREEYDSTFQVVE